MSWLRDLDRCATLLSNSIRDYRSASLDPRKGGNCAEIFMSIQDFSAQLESMTQSCAAAPHILDLLHDAKVIIQNRGVKFLPARSTSSRRSRIDFLKQKKDSLQTIQKQELEMERKKLEHLRNVFDLEQRISKMELDDEEDINNLDDLESIVTKPDHKIPLITVTSPSQRGEGTGSVVMDKGLNTENWDAGRTEARDQPLKTDFNQENGVPPRGSGFEFLDHPISADRNAENRGNFAESVKYREHFSPNFGTTRIDASARQPMAADPRANVNLDQAQPQQQPELSFRNRELSDPRQNYGGTSEFNYQKVNMTDRYSQCHNFGQPNFDTSRDFNQNFSGDRRFSQNFGTNPGFSQNSVRTLDANHGFSQNFRANQGFDQNFDDNREIESNRNFDVRHEISQNRGAYHDFPDHVRNVDSRNPERDVVNFMDNPRETDFSNSRNYENQRNPFSDRDPATRSNLSVHREHVPTNFDFVSQMRVAMALPKIEVPIFSGKKGEDYMLFIETVENVIERNCHDQSLRLQQLISRTDGKARSYIKDCIYLNPDCAYLEAKRILDERYGVPADIVRTALDKLSKGLTLKQSDREGLLDLNSEISAVHRMLGRLDCRLDADAPERLKCIVNRLPFNWRTNFIKRLGLRMPKFVDLVDFMNDSIKVTRNPFFADCFAQSSKQKDSEDDDTRPPSKGGSRFSNNNYQQTDKNPPKDRYPKQSWKCFVCPKEHPPWQCEEFLAKTVEERVLVIVKSGRCLNCLIGTDHLAGKCPKSSFCRVSGCTTRLAHHRLCHPLPDLRKLVPRRDESRTSANDTSTAECPEEDDEGTILQATLGGAASTYLQTVPVKVYDKHKNRQVITYAILDSGSDSVIVDLDIVRALGLSGEIVYTRFRGSTSEARLRTELVNLVVTSLDDGPEIFLPGAKGLSDCAFKRARVPEPAEISLHKHLKHVADDRPTMDAKFIRPLLLIGTNASECFVQEDIRKGEQGLIAIKGVLGWSVMGSRQNSESMNSDCNLTEVLDCDLDSKVELFWKLEEINAAHREKGLSVEDRAAIKIMDDSKKLISDHDGPHYQLSLLWKEFPPPLDDNRRQALQRLLALKGRFKKQPEYFEMYKTQIEDYLKNGYAVSVADEPILEQHGANYIPHHGVISPKKPGKVRTVFNCASVSPSGASLNDCIYSGPDNTNRLVAVLIRWREGKIAICADVEAMYHRVRVCPQDYSFLRFLWYKNSNLDGEIIDLYMKVHLFGCVSSSACANYALQQTAEDNPGDHPPFVIQSVKSSFYVDDFAQSHDNPDVAIEHCQELQALLRKGGFHLKKFDSNSKFVLDSVSPEDRAPCITSVGEGRIQSILGVDWRVSHDHILLCPPSPPKPSTRCGILGFVMGRFDPLGLEAPIIFPVKCLLQELCRQGLQWKEELPSPLIERWHQILEDIVKMDRIELPRCYKMEHSSLVMRTELHTFCDASSLGYACVSYLRFIYDGQFHLSIVAAKSRVAPMKPPTIRRLEFQGALTAARQSAKVIESLDMNIDQVYFWTDCTTVLKYLHNEKRRFQVYIANRVHEIHQTSVPGQWKYVPSADNCADDATRILPTSSINAKSRWFVGPRFLYLPQAEWPSQPLDLELDSSDPELKKDIFCNVGTSDDESSFVKDYFEHFSSLPKLIRCTAWMQRLIQILQSRLASTSSQPAPPARVGTLSICELRNARETLLKLCQRQVFSTEHQTLSSNPEARISKSSPLHPLGVFMLDGIICLKGRLRYAEIHQDTRHPAVLPKSHPFTTLIIRDTHVIHGHQGVNYVLGEIRTKYWIIHGKVAIAKELRCCVPCQRYNARPMQQMMADLPPERLLAPEYPFQFTGLDAFGPFLVTTGRKTKKVWVIIFSCLSYRCVHLEVIMSMKTDSFILAYRRFISRRGKVSVIISDRGSNFVSAERELREALVAWNDSKIEETLKQDGTKWKFNAAGASHHGGVYERLIRSARSVLHHTLYGLKRTVDIETFQCVMTEVESILNGRPLQPASSDPNDMTPLTPNHVLLMRSNPNLPPGIFKESDTQLRKRWKVCQAIVNQASRRLMKDYLASLNTRSKWLKIRESIALDDLVLICDSGLHRSDWKLARVTKLFPGRDGLVRSVGLRTVSAKLITRPISKICLLEGIGNDLKIRH